MLLSNLYLIIPVSEVDVDLFQPSLMFIVLHRCVLMWLTCFDRVLLTALKIISLRPGMKMPSSSKSLAHGCLPHPHPSSEHFHFLGLSQGGKFGLLICPAPAALWRILSLFISFLFFYVFFFWSTKPQRQHDSPLSMREKEELPLTLRR